MRALLILIIVLTGVFSGFAQDDIKWLTFGDAKKAFDKERKPIVINFFDAKNDSCQMMMDSVFNDKVVKSYLNNYFYTVNIDVGTKESITFFDGKTYKPKADGGHELIDLLIPGVKLPAVLFFSKQAQGSAYNNYIDKHEMIGHLLYYSEEAYLNSDWEDFYEQYSTAFPKDKGRGFTIVKTVVDWLTMEEALEKQKEKPKKIFLDIYANWRNISTIMLVSTYSNDTIAKILNEEFYPVRFEATTRDSMHLKGTTFKNPAKNKKEKLLHEFVQMLLLSNKVPVAFPTLIFFDEKKTQPMRFYQGYFSAKGLEPLLRYFSTDAFKKQKFEQFKANYKK